ncbi:hypothetical protein [Nioella sp.]|uniref:hypothetical protein n=1 Tax=Nioella sp. TaxID=1912091 RepID=UPI003A8B91CA
MATTLKQVEATPASYPAVTPFDREGYLDPDVVPDADQVWQRIEAYTAYRWTARDVVWTVEGPGEWVPPLGPATISTTELWVDGTGWTSCTLDASPFGGYVLPGEGPYRVSGSVGGGDLPAAVSEAFKRLYEYTRGINDSFKNETAFTGSDEGGIVRNWTGKALQLSGAADLLRPYRRA